MNERNQFREGKLFPSLIKFTLPVLLTLCLQTMYGAVDFLVVVQFSDAVDVSALTTGSRMLHMITAIVTGLSMGTTILLGQAFSVIIYVMIIKKRGLPFPFERENIRFNRDIVWVLLKKLYGMAASFPVRKNCICHDTGNHGCFWCENSGILFHEQIRTGIIVSNRTGNPLVYDSTDSIVCKLFCISV